jgi:hypothetical protein
VSESCACCAEEGIALDHIYGNGALDRLIFVGISEFRTFVEENAEARAFLAPGLQWLCRPCNSSKGKGSVCRKHGKFLGAATPNPLYADYSGYIRALLEQLDLTDTSAEATLMLAAEQLDRAQYFQTPEQVIRAFADFEQRVPNVERRNRLLLDLLRDLLYFSDTRKARLPKDHTERFFENTDGVSVEAALRAAADPKGLFI